MEIKQKPVGNYWPGREAGPPIAIVDHCMSRTSGGQLATMEGTLSWFNNRNSEASAHYGVARDGRIWQFVADEDTAWGNGIIQKPDLSIKWLAQAIEDKINPNRLTISIEHEGDGIMPMPEAQYQATLALHRNICGNWGIPRDSQHIIRHGQITGIDRANCPGVSFPMARLLKELNVTDKTFNDPVTGFMVPGPFAAFYLANGGLPIFGRPITPRIAAVGYGAAIAVQWFERARFEAQPDGSIMLGLVGREAYLKAI